MVDLEPDQIAVRAQKKACAELIAKGGWVNRYGFSD